MPSASQTACARHTNLRIYYHPEDVGHLLVDDYRALAEAAARGQPQREFCRCLLQNSIPYMFLILRHEHIGLCCAQASVVGRLQLIPRDVGREVVLARQGRMGW